MPYGKRELVEKLLRDMEAQKHQLIMTKGEEKRVLWIDGQVRVLPFGLYEYVFPKEDLDLVLRTLVPSANKDRYSLGEIRNKVLRKIVKAEPLPDYALQGNKFLWVKENVEVIPIGIRKDSEIVGNALYDDGYTHEAI